MTIPEEIWVTLDTRAPGTPADQGISLTVASL